LGSCLEALADQQRVAFTLREVEGFTTDEEAMVRRVLGQSGGPPG